MIGKITFSIHGGHVSILFKILLIHNFFISLTDQSNKEVNHNDCNKNIYNEPNHPNNVDHNRSK